MADKKAVVLVVPADNADDVARLVAAALSLNGYRHDDPAVIDWPLSESAAPVHIGPTPSDTQHLVSNPYAVQNENLDGTTWPE